MRLRACSSPQGSLQAEAQRDNTVARELRDERGEGRLVAVLEHRKHRRLPGLGDGRRHRVHPMPQRRARRVTTDGVERGRPRPEWAPAAAAALKEAAQLGRAPMSRTSRQLDIVGKELCPQRIDEHIEGRALHRRRMAHEFQRQRPRRAGWRSTEATRACAGHLLKDGGEPLRVAVAEELLLKGRAEDLLWRGPRAASMHAGRADAVVRGAFLGVAEHLVRFRDFLEDLRVAPSLVGVMFEGELLVGRLDLGNASLTRDAQSIIEGQIIVVGKTAHGPQPLQGSGFVAPSLRPESTASSCPSLPREPKHTGACNTLAHTREDRSARILQTQTSRPVSQSVFHGPTPRSPLQLDSGCPSCRSAMRRRPTWPPVSQSVISRSHPHGPTPRSPLRRLSIVYGRGSVRGELS